MQKIEPAMTQAEIADILQVAPRNVVERYAKLPGFPQPFRLPSKNGQGPYRWDRNSFVTWYKKVTGQ